MRTYAPVTLLLLLALLAGCSRTVLVPVPPRVDLSTYRTVGIVEFASNSERAINAHATRQFQEQIQAAQPGTRFIELGDRQALLAAVGGRQLDIDAFRKIGEKYGVAARRRRSVPRRHRLFGAAHGREDRRPAKARRRRAHGGERRYLQQTDGDRERRQRVEQLGMGQAATRQRQRLSRARRERQREQIESARRDGAGPGLPADARFPAELGPPARAIVRPRQAGLFSSGKALCFSSCAKFVSDDESTS